MNSEVRRLVMAGYIIIFSAQCQRNFSTSNVKDSAVNWEKIGPGGGGATFIPTFSYHSAENFLLRCDMTGSYLTKDGGQSYQQINFANGASAYAYDPEDSSTIYIGSAVLNQSKDGGKTWQVIFPKKEEIVNAIYTGDHASYHIETLKGSLYESSGNIDHIRVDPVSSASLYFNMGNFFFYTSDQGAT
ncbi:MAG: exo-alpha-sialidase, partial [Chitinophagaceae bacterium]|nr:exo-alpha-sialidase [Chitinophagaceae bacterium]